MSFLFLQNIMSIMLKGGNQAFEMDVTVHIKCTHVTINLYHIHYSIFNICKMQHKIYSQELSIHPMMTRSSWLMRDG